MNKIEKRLFYILVVFFFVFSVHGEESSGTLKPKSKIEIINDLEEQLRWDGGIPWYRARLRVECLKYNPVLPYPAMRRTMWLESRENPSDVEYKRGRKISFGLFQLSTETGMTFLAERKIQLPKGMTIQQWLLDPENNIICGCWWFDRNRRIFRGNWYLAIMAHNLGPDGAIKMYREHGYWWPHSGQKLGPRLDALCRARVLGTADPF